LKSLIPFEIGNRKTGQLRSVSRVEEIEEKIIKDEPESVVPQPGKWGFGMLLALLVLIALGTFFVLKDRPTQQAGQAVPQPQVQGDSLVQKPQPLVPPGTQKDTRRGKGFQPNEGEEREATSPQEVHS